MLPSPLPPTSLTHLVGSAAEPSAPSNSSDQVNVQPDVSSKAPPAGASTTDASAGSVAITPAPPASSTGSVLPCEGGGGSTFESPLAALELSGDVALGTVPTLVPLLTVTD